jgi:hypothetical protein
MSQVGILPRELRSCSSVAERLMYLRRLFHAD